MKLDIVDTDILDIYLDIFLPEDKDVYESIDMDSEAKTIINDIKDIIEDFGYMEADPPYQSKANSLYFTFLDTDQFLDQEVNLIIRMRVSDHKVPLWDCDRTEQDAKNRQLGYLKAFAHSLKDFNKNICGTDEEIPVDYLYIEYENEFYTEPDDVYKKIRRRLAEFRNMCKKRENSSNKK